MLQSRTFATALVAILLASTGDHVGRSHAEPDVPRIALQTKKASAVNAKSASWWTIRKDSDSSATGLDSVLGANSATTWSADPANYEITTDPSEKRSILVVLKDKNLALTGLTKYPADVDVRALVRLRTGAAPGASAAITVGQKNNAEGKPENMTLSLRRTAKDNTIACNVAQSPTPFHDREALVKISEWGDVQVSDAFSDKLWAYPQSLPGWEEDFRRRVEADMTSIPDADHKWLDVRIELRKGLVRFWVDDRIVAWKQHDALNPEGTVTLNLSAGTELASLRVAPARETSDYLPIPLGGYANANKLVGQAQVETASLPPAGAVVQVGNVPFVFAGVNPEGNDHIDIGRSYFRQANAKGYIPSLYGNLARWPGAAERDPGRIQLRISNGQYDSLYLIAASDGDKEEIPKITAMFYRPGAGFPVSFEATVPELLQAAGGEAKALPVQLTNGKQANLWLVRVPLDPGKLSSFGDMDVVEVELTKEVKQYRTYPDPIGYSFHQAGRASAVHLYAATLGRVRVAFQWNPDIFGHVWTAPAEPAYTATLTNNTVEAQAGKLTVVTRSFDGTEETRQEKTVTLSPRPMDKTDPQKIAVPVPVKLFGYHDITATLQIGDRTWIEKWSLVKLAPDTRSARWTEGKGALFGYWSYGGGHHTPKAAHHVRLMTLAGARTAMGHPANLPPDVQAMVDKHWSATQAGAWEVEPQPWAADENPDPAKVAAFQKDIIEKIKAIREKIPAERRPDHVYFYPEPHISARLTAGNVPAQDAPVEYMPEEQQRLKMFFNTSKFAAEAVRRDLPGLKVLIPWGDAGFTWPLLRAGFPKELVDGQGVDTPGFERIPERQLHEQSIHRYYWINKEWQKFGKKPHLQTNEGIFVPTEPGGVSWREQMDIYNRWSVLSMAYGVSRFYSGWFACDCTNYYGAEHYGGCGIQAKIPYANPKPAYAAFATMTDKLNEANFDGWLPTGSLNTFALRFKHETRGPVYTLWTLRGTRPLTITLKDEGKVNVTDSMNNTKEVATKDKTVTIPSDQSVIYITGGEIVSVAAGETNHANSQPAKDAKLVADLGDGSWKYTNRKDPILETNHWGIAHFPGKFTASIASDANHGNVLASKLEKQDAVHETMPWYNVLKPAKPAVLPAAPSKIGIWAKGQGDWGRVIYILRDAKGERWTSIGAKDDYNCDDVHSWSQFCFDGWRYLTFELPGHEGFDNYRKFGTTWWRADGGEKGSENVVDLPLSLEEIIVEQRTHILYVNDLQPAPSDTIQLGKLFVEYDTPADATPEAVRISKLRMPVPKDPPNLPNPIAEMTAKGELPPTKLTKLTPPEHQYDGTRMHVHFDAAPSATNHFVWVSAHADGRGAVNLTPGGLKPGDLIGGLRPGIKLYYWITYIDAAAKASKPSPVHEEVTVDNFKEK